MKKYGGDKWEEGFWDKVESEGLIVEESTNADGIQVVKLVNTPAAVRGRAPRPPLSAAAAAARAASIERVALRGLPQKSAANRAARESSLARVAAR